MATFDYRIVAIIVLIAAIIFLVLAIWLEVQDYGRLNSRPPIDEICGDSEKEKEKRFYACYNYENAIDWRSIYLASFMATVVLSVILELIGYHWLADGKYYVPLIIITIVFIAFHTIWTFKRFHLHRVMCSKVDDRIHIM